jgi:class I lanthipeptide synthase
MTSLISSGSQLNSQTGDQLATSHASRAGRSWQPLLSGADADLAHEVVLAIARDLAERPPSDHPGIGGFAGLAVFYAYVFRALKEARSGELAADYHALAVAGAEQARLSPALYGGYSGIGWTDEHLTGFLFDCEDQEEVTAVDGALHAVLAPRPGARVYDLIAGLVGFGVYALERHRRHPSSEFAPRAVSAILSRLTEAAEETPRGLTWHTPPELIFEPNTKQRFPNGYYNVGVAHGVPGVIALLALMVRARIESDRAAALLKPAVHWLLAQQMGPDSNSTFPSWLTPNEPVASRAAWCYGDPGVSASLFLAGDACGEEAWRQKALEVATRSLNLPYQRTGIEDAGICHGAAGLAQIAQRLYWESSSPEMASAATLWLRRTLALYRPGQGIGGYRAWNPRRDQDGRYVEGQREWQSDASFLTGSVGIGLTLLAGITDVAPDWDRLLFLS